MEEGILILRWDWMGWDRIGDGLDLDWMEEATCGLPSFGIWRTFYHNWDFCLSLGRGLRKMDWATCSSLKRELPVVVSFFPPKRPACGLDRMTSRVRPTNQNQSVFGALL